MSAIAAAAALVTTAAWAVDRLMPPVDRIELVDRSGHVSFVPPPTELALIGDRERRPAPVQGGLRLVTNFVLIGVIGVVGRRLLRLRLD